MCFLVPLLVFSTEYKTIPFDAKDSSNYVYSFFDALNIDSGFDIVSLNRTDKKNTYFNTSSKTSSDTKLPKWMAFGAAAFTSTTPFEYAVDFDGNNDYLVANTNADWNNPLRRSFMSGVAAGSGKTANGGQPWATSVVFRHTDDGGQSGLWSQTAGTSEHDHNGRLLLAVVNNKLTFYLGRHKPGSSWWWWNDKNHISWRADTNLVSGKWYAVYVDYNGIRTDDLATTPFRIRLVDISTGAVSTPSGDWYIDDQGYTGTITGDFYVGARFVNAGLSHGMIASVVATTLKQGEDLPSDTEIREITLDPLKWLNDYKVGRDWRQPDVNGTTSNFQINPNDASLGAFGTKVWLMGDGVNDNANNIENQVASDVAAQDLLTRNMSNPITALKPVFTSATAVAVMENIVTTAYTASAVKISALVYSFGSGNDEALFNIDPITGEVTFKNSPDFENPTDANGDNVYKVNITVTNIFGDSENQDVDISVTNVMELVTTFTDVNKTYGDPNFDLLATSNSGGVITYSIVSATSVGTTLGGLNNETVSLGSVGTVTVRATVAQHGTIDGGYIDMTLSIGKKAIVVSADNATKVYGEADPVLSYSIVPSLKAGDVLTGVLQRTAGENVGSYAINQGTLGANVNYTLSYSTGGVLSITEKEIQITPIAGQTKIYGTTDSVLTYDVSPSMIAGDTFTGNLSRTFGQDVGSYPINIGSLSAGSNYLISFNTGIDFSITPKEISITPVAGQSKIYGETDPLLSFNNAPVLESGDFFMGSLTRVPGESVGFYTITQGDVSAGANYTIKFISGIDFMIVPQEVTVTPQVGQSKVYGETDPIFTYTVSPSLELGDVFSGQLLRNPGENVGDYDIIEGSLDAGANYTVKFIAGIDFSITSKQITVTPLTAQSKVYGSIGSVLNYDVSPNLETGDSFTGSLARNPGENIGDYSIVQGSLDAGLNYSILFSSGVNYTISPKEISITPNPGQSKVFGSVDPVFTYTTAPLLESGDNFIGQLDRTSGENTGNYAIGLGTLTAGTNYTIVFNAGVDFSITSKEINITPRLSQSKIYGALNPILTFDNVPLLESGDVFTGSLVRVTGENVGSYAINQGSLDAGPNYTLKFNSSIDFSISPKSITVTPNAGQFKVYGETNPVYTYGVSPALEVGDVFSGELSRTPGENVGVYSITKGSLDAGSNYNLLFNSGIDFSISAKTITITPTVSQTKVYGASDAILTYSVTPNLEIGDAFSGSLNRVPGENIGAYEIVEGTLTAGVNYALIFTSGIEFLITPKIISVTPTAGQSKVFGSVDPIFKYTIAPQLESGDAFTGALQRIPGENIGDYAISRGTINAGSNYTIVFNSGVDFSITPKEIRITPTMGQSKVYGQVDPVLTYTYAPDLELGDSFTGNAVRVLGENIGNFEISQGTLSAGPNYTLLFDSGIDFSITAKTITITPTAGQSKVYGDADPILAYNVSSGLESGDLFYGNLSRVVGENIGDYAITKGSLTAGSNYILVYNLGVDFSITPKTITITPVASQTKFYGEIDPELFYDITPALVMGDVLTGKLNRVSGENIGTYSITKGNIAASANYSLLFTPGVNFNITAKDVFVTPLIGQSKVYGEGDPILKYDIAPALELGDVLTGELSRGVGENVGVYEINQGSLNTTANYNLVFTSNIDFIISTKQIKVTPTENQSKIFGGVDPILTYNIVPSLFAGDALTGNLLRTPGEDVGAYDISKGTLDAGPNYSFVFDSGVDFSITPKDIMITPVSGQNKVYGESDYKLKYTMFPALESGDILTGNLTRVFGEGIGLYEISRGDLMSNMNYNLMVASGVDFEILPKKIIVTPNAGQFKEYGENDPPLTFTINPLSEDSSILKGSLVRTAGENIGTYEILKGSLSAPNNYELEVISGIDFTIVPAMPTIEFSDIVKVYGDDNFSLNATSDSDGTVSYSIVGAANGTSLSGANNQVVSIGNAGKVIIRASYSGTTNYVESYKEIVLTIEKAILSAKAENVSRVYRTENPDFTISYSGFVNSDTAADIDVEPRAKTIATIDSNVGEYYIVLYGGWDDNYIIQSGIFSLGVLTIIERIPSLVFSNINKVYGDPDFSLEATTTSVGEITYSFIGDAGETTLSGIGNHMVSIGNAGIIRIRATVEGTTNFASVTRDIILTVEKADLIARADDMSRVYGVENPELTINYEGFVYDDTKLDLDEEPVAITIADITSNVGEYYILIFGGNDKNYNIIAGVLNPGVFTIIPQNPTLEFDNITKTYGDADFKLAAVTDSDIPVTYTIVGEANGTVLSGARNENVSLGNVGAVKVRATYGASVNFEGITKEILLVIKKAKLSVELKDVSKQYGQEDPAFEYVITSGDMKVGEDIFLTRVKGEDIGSYSIFPSIANFNYEISYEKASLNITKAAVTVSAMVQSKMYGEEDPILTYEFIEGALASWDEMELSREIGEDVGFYKIYSSFENSNYDITYIGADFEITQSVITVKADEKTKGYGSLDPVLSYEITSGLFVEGDVFEGELIREEGEEIGAYTIYSTLSHPNYLITYISADLIIVVSELTITIDHLTKGYGTEDPEFTYKITSGDRNNTLDFTNLLKREPGEEVGVYKVYMEYSNDNYLITIVDGSLTIEKIVPVVSTMEAADVSGKTALFEGKLISNGGNEVTEQGFMLGFVNSNLVAKNSSVLVRIELDAKDPFRSIENNLNSETTYYYRAYAVNSMGIGYGEIKSFTTLDITAPSAPIVLQAAGFTCPNNREVTSDNNFIIVGKSEPESIVEVFINGSSEGFGTTDLYGNWTLDLSDVTQEDGTYNVTAIATDLSYNSSVLSEIYTILISTENSDLDNIPDHCDDDDDNDGYLDANQIQEKKGYGISPNGDGINDVLEIRDIEDYPNNELSIFSRSGALVYKANGYDNTWDGRNMFTSGDAKLPEGAYFFVLDLKTSGKHIVQGWIYIKY